MAWSELFTAMGGLTAIIAVAAFIGKLVAEKSADAALKQFESSLKRTEEEHRYALLRIEEEQKSLLRRQEELQKSASAFTSEIDIDLRTKRIGVYSLLWEKTGLLPMWPRNTGLEYEHLDKLTREFRDWYFAQGGMYLSETARDAYFEVQKNMTSILESNPKGHVSDEHYTGIRQRCSALRTELTNDILTRREAPAFATRQVS